MCVLSPCERCYRPLTGCITKLCKTMRHSRLISRWGRERSPARVLNSRRIYPDRSKSYTSRDCYIKFRFQIHGQLQIKKKKKIGVKMKVLRNEPITSSLEGVERKNEDREERDNRWPGRKVLTELSQRFLTPG